MEYLWALTGSITDRDFVEGGGILGSTGGSSDGCRVTALAA